MRQPWTQACAYCGGRFETNVLNRLYCSKSCRNKRQISATRDKAQHAAKQHARYHRLMNDPVWRQRERERSARRYRTDPRVRERLRENDLRRYRETVDLVDRQISAAIDGPVEEALATLLQWSSGQHNTEN